MTSYEKWILLIGIATFLVALATFLHVSFEKRIKVKVNLQITQSTPPLAKSSPPILQRKEHSHLILQAYVHNEGKESIFYRDYNLFIDNQKIKIQPMISPRIVDEQIGSHQHATFTYAVSSDKEEIPVLIENKEKIHIKFGVTLHDNKERMSKPILVLIKPK